MRAAFLVGPRRLELREVPAPEPPADGLVLAVRACGVCGSDLRRWREGPAVGGTEIVPGHEVAGVVEAVGPRVEGFRPGDRLALAPDVHCGRCWYCRRGLFNLCDDLRIVGITPEYAGGMAERMVVPADVLERGVVHRLPEGLPYVLGALAEPLSSVLACHEMLGTRLGDVVAVIGAGAIGCLHVAVARARGARAIVSQRSAPRRALVAAFGPELVIDAGSDDVVARARAFTGGLGVDAAICANPVAASQVQALQMVRKGGRVVLFGGLPKAAPEVTLDANRIHYGEIKVEGSFSYAPAMHALALEVLARGVIPAERLITHTYSLADVAAAFETADRGEGLKVMVTMDDPLAGQRA